jgi:hypothetical protein
VVVVFFFRPGDANASKVLDSVRTHAGSMEGQGVATVGVALSSSEQQVRAALADHRIVSPVHFDEKTGNAPVAKLWKVAPDASRIFLLDPRLRVVNDDVPPGTLGDVLRQQLELTPPEFVPTEVIRQAEEKLAIAEIMLSSDRPRSAARYLAELPAEARTDSGTAARVSAATIRLEAFVPKLIDASEALFNDNQIAEAVLLLEHTAAALPDSPARDRVLDQLFSFTDDPEIREAAEKGRPAATAADLLLASGEHEELLDRLGAYRLCQRILTEFAATPAADTARQHITDWEKDPAEKLRLRDALAGPAPGRLLTTARAYQKSNLLPKAKQFYQQILTDYPGTSAAAEAEKELAGMK